MLSIQLSALGKHRRGQAIIFSAVSVVLLAFFIALVYNLGQITERRAGIQIAADSAAYSGAMVMANSLSSIAWINDGMAQIHSRLIRYVVDVNTTAVLAELENRQLPVDIDYPIPTPSSNAAEDAYIEAIQRAHEWIPRGKEWMRDLSRIQHTISLVTPRLMQETMYDVANDNGSERVSIYPTTRLFPHAGSERSFRIEQFEEGWRITNLDPDSGEMLWVYREDGEWNIVYSRQGITRERIRIIEIAEDEWVILRYDGSGNLLQEITIIRTDELGWIVVGRTPDEPPDEPGVRLSFEQVDMTEDGEIDGTRVTDAQGRWQVFRREGGELYIWDRSREEYISMTQEYTEIGGIPIRVNVTNVIRFPGATVRVGDPVRVDIGRAHIVLTDPPNITTGIGPVSISVRGFDSSSFRISVNNFTLHVDSADGRWRKYFNPSIDLWWRHRLTRQDTIDPDALYQWQYDYQLIGAHLLYEGNIHRFSLQNGIMAGAGAGQIRPEWLDWFNVLDWNPAPYELTYRQEEFEPYWPAGRPAEEPLFRPMEDPPDGAYFRTMECQVCDGEGYLTVGTEGERVPCPNCLAKDHDINGLSDLRVFLADAAGSDYLEDIRADAGVLDTEENYMTLNVFQSDTYGVASPPNRPLVLNDEFFKYGVNVAAWRGREEAPMLFDREPDWGFVAVASARIGVPTGNVFGPYYVYGPFDMPPEYGGSYDRDPREQWVDEAPENLYRTGLQARLVSSRRTIHEYDLEHERAMAFAPIAETPVTYLWDALMFTAYSHFDEPSIWLDDYGGRTDRDVPRLLRNMRDRQGRTFDVTDPDIEPLIHH